MGVKNFAIGFAIAIMLPFVIHYGVITFSPAAEYQGYSKEAFVKAHLEIEPDKTKPDAIRKEALEKEYDAGIERFNRHLFFVAVPTGILSIAVGLMVSIPGIGSGFMFGGLLILMYGYFTYWSDLPISVRFASLLGGLILFIVIGWLKHGKKS